MNAGKDSRVIRFEGAKNVRDLGGLRTASGAETRRGFVYRADGLSRLTERDLELLASLGIATIIDLRYDEERAKAPDRLPPGSATRFFVRGFLPQGSVEMFEWVNNKGADAAKAYTLMRDNYARIPYEHADAFRDVMHHVIAPGSAPHLIHCTSGKDRTGIIVAFILLALGVAVDDVVGDYELSHGDWQPVDAFARSARREAVDVVMAANPDYLRAALDAIDRRSGSFDAYLSENLGFGDRERHALASLMLG